MSSLQSYAFINENVKKQTLFFQTINLKNSFKFIIIILILIFTLINNIIFEKSFKNELKNDSLKIEHYYKICNKGILLDKITKKCTKNIYL